MSEFSPNTSVRQPAVAGLFYPKDADTLRSLIGRLLDAAQIATPMSVSPKALIVPHAGYPYSGSIAAAAYSLLKPLRSHIRRVVLMGPSHRVFLHGIALPRAHVFATPLGEIRIDAMGRDLLLARGDVLASDAPHEFEHCIEVQLPFLQIVLEDFSLLPLVVGSTNVAHVASVLEEVWNDAETVILASSDLSHYLSYESAQQTDAATAAAIIRRQADIKHEQACGAAAINGLLTAATDHEFEVTEIARCNSGDTSGDIRRVVGYGAFALHESSVRASH